MTFKVEVWQDPGMFVGLCTGYCIVIAYFAI